jgi:nickel-dependent lactate racemase
MRIRLLYGTEGISVDVPSRNVTVVQPTFEEGLTDERSAFERSVRSPIESPPLRESVHSSDRVAIVIPDVTRPLPTARLLPWVMAELSHVPDRNLTIVSGTGSHRENTREELIAMVGDEVMSRVRVVNHTAHDPTRLILVGTSADGSSVYMNREYAAADRRIVLGFIEPHFMAGFSGGYKGVFPALADIDSIMRYHNASTIGDPRSTWGLLDGNPTQERIRANGSLLPVDFCVNVTLNRQRHITGFYCGEVLAAHIKGCEFAKATAMACCERAYPIVVTTNGGFPLDQNLYQTVKGMSAGAQIVVPGGFILAVSECSDGFPSHGHFRKLLFEHDSPQAILDTVSKPGFSLYDQWEAQLMAIILLKARVGLFSSLPPDEVRRAHLEPIPEISRRIADELHHAGKGAPIAVLPEGPMTIPYLADCVSR